MIIVRCEVTSRPHHPPYLRSPSYHYLPTHVIAFVTRLASLWPVGTRTIRARRFLELPLAPGVLRLARLALCAWHVLSSSMQFKQRGLTCPLRCCIQRWPIMTADLGPNRLYECPSYTTQMKVGIIAARSCPVGHRANTALCVRNHGYSRHRYLRAGAPRSVAGGGTPAD